MGIYVFEPEVLEFIRRGERLDLPDLIVKLLDAGWLVAAYPFDGFWLDIGRHADYETAIDTFTSIRDELLRPHRWWTADRAAAPVSAELRRRGGARRR